MTTVSFKEYLQGVIHNFCTAENIPCALTNDAIVQLISSLATYKEEGHSLTPDVFLCENIEIMRQVSASGKILPIASGTLDASSIKLALKRCAPLAIGGWAIYIERNSTDKKISYGLIWTNQNPLSVSTTDVFLDPELDTSIVYATQLSENVVLIGGNHGNTKIVSLSPEKDITNPDIPIGNLIDVAASDVVDDIADEVAALLKRELQRILKTNHGTLIAIVKHGNKVPKEISKGIFLREPLSIVDKAQEFKKIHDIDSHNILQSQILLLDGMLSCDGITLLDTAGNIIAYGIFYKSTNDQDKEEQIYGGARKRTYLGLSELVPNQLKAVLMKSQDGSIECKVE
ncbi:hypothetical protein GM415_10130 [Pseudodesulfovibrio cashew]|uniref:DAC domain-containing protein n=1 Tax=Pseudodesulfovibrio cashew TaxID=2678688 RepID=A0A6I6JHH5_9BACT|nr:hypothetical protein [Pseudodesulfovibrio cashew]QGY40468.1 hypothetical protein GM415_10130 [Pseudodesulfovibrio cashew]